MGSATRKEGDTIANLDADWKAKQAYYGLDPEYANSPWSQAAALQRSRDVGQRVTMNSAGRRLYSGATRARQGVIDTRYQQGRAGLQEQHDADLRAYMQNREQAQRQRQEEEEDARISAAERAAEAEPDASAAPAPAGGNRRPKVRPKRGRR